jgi:hypothetical protein
MESPKNHTTGLTGGGGGGGGGSTVDLPHALNKTRIESAMSFFISVGVLR